MHARFRWLLALLALTAAVHIACAARGSAPESDRVHLRLGFVGPNIPGVGVPAVASLLSSSNLLFRDISTANPSAGIIERVDVSADGLRHQLHLRPGLRLHDGTPLSAAALERAFSSLQTAPVLFPHGLIERVTTTADSTLEIALRRPSPLFLESLVDVAPPVDASRAGAFVPEATTDTSLGFRAFDQYFLGRPSVASLDVSVFATWRTAWGAMLRGEVDGLWEAPTEAVDFIGASSEFRIYSSPRRYAYVLGFNIRTPELRDPRARQAFAHAIDRDRFVSVALRGHGQAADTQLYPTHWAAPSGFRPLSFDRSRAMTLLRDAGQGRAAPREARRASSVKEGSADRVLELECLVPADDRFERVAQELQRQLSLAGIELNLVALPIRELLQRLSSGRFETYILEVAGQSPLYFELFWSQQRRPTLDSGYTAAESTLAALRDAGSIDEVRGAVARIQETLRDDPPAVFLAYPTVARVLHRRFIVPPSPDDASLVSQRVLPFIRLGASTEGTAP